MSLSEKFKQLNTPYFGNDNNKRSVVRKTITVQQKRMQTRSRGMKPPQSAYRKKGRYNGGGDNSNGNNRNSNAKKFKKNNGGNKKSKKEKAKDHPQLDMELKNFMSGEKPNTVGDLQSIQ